MDKKEKQYWPYVVIFFVLLLGYTVLAQTCHNATHSNPTIKNDSDSVSIVNEDSSLIDDSNNTSSVTDEQKDSIIQSLHKNFVFKTDEFDSSDNYTVFPNNKPKYVNINKVYCYFTLYNKVSSNLRFVIQYTADDWLFINEYVFNIDGSVYDYVPDNVETDCGNGGQIWEWSDQQVGETEQPLIDAIKSANKIKIKFVGKQYYDTRTLNSSEVYYLKETIKAFESLNN